MKVNFVTVTFLNILGKESELISVSSSYSSIQVENGKIQVDLKNMLFGERRHVVCKVRVPLLPNPASVTVINKIYRNFIEISSSVFLQQFVMILKMFQIYRKTLFLK